jgi:hypothetical protein
MDDPRPDGTGQVGRDPNAVVPVAPGAGGSRIVGWVVVAALLVGVAVLKPWAGGRPESSPATGAGAAEATVAPGRSVGASRSPVATSDGIDADVSLACLEPASWRVASIEAYDGRTIRIWRALEPGPASGPDDPDVPFVLLASERVSELGWCAPAAGSDRPIGQTAIRAWTLVNGQPRPLRLVRTDRTPRQSSFGAMYAPSSVVPGRQVAPLAGWPAGRYVFRLTLHDGAERWFGVDLELRPAVAPGRPSPGPSAGITSP